MNDASAVRGFETGGALQRDGDGVLARKTSGIQPLAQSYAVDQFGGNEPGTRVVADLVNGDGVWMVEGGGGAGLGLQTSHSRGIMREVGRENLQGNFAAETGISSAVHLAHASGTQDVNDLVGSERGSDATGSGVRSQVRDLPYEAIGREEIADPVTRVEEGFDLAAQLWIVATGRVEQRGTVPRRSLGDSHGTPLRHEARDRRA